MIGAHVEQAAADHLEHIRVDDFRHQDGVGRGVGGGGEIVGMPGRVDAVDADEHLALAEAAGLDRVDNLLARRFLGVGRDRILKIENDAVGGKRLGLLQRAGIGARHVQHAAARTDGHAANSIGRPETIKPRSCLYVTLAAGYLAAAACGLRIL